MRASIVYFSILASLVASANALEIAPARRGVAILSRNNDGKHLPLDIRCTDWELTIIIRHHFDKLMAIFDRTETVDSVDRVDVDKRSGVDKVDVDKRSAISIGKHFGHFDLVRIETKHSTSLLILLRMALQIFLNLPPVSSVRQA